MTYHLIIGAVCWVILVDYIHCKPILDHGQSEISSLDNTQEGVVDARYLTAHDIILAANEANGMNLFEGDIKSLPPRYRTAVSDRSRLWPETTIPYTMDSTYDSDEVASIVEALAEFHNKTCMQFVPRKGEQDYIYFVQHKGCYSSVGRTGDQQELTLGKPCLTRGTAIHEIMHALGFWHEQNRSDRDSYIQILWDNIKDGREFNFEKFPISDVDVLGAPYDYGSVMHYSATAFSKNGQNTIRPKKPTTFNLGQRDHLSVVDAWKVNKLYNCVPTHTTNLHAPPRLSTTPAVGPPTPPPLHPVKGPHYATPPRLPHRPRTPPPLLTTTPHNAWGSFSDWSPCDINCNAKRSRLCLDFITQDCGPGESVENYVCPPPCIPASYIGCWRNNASHPAIPMIENQHSNTLEFHTLEAYRECADAANELGYPVFALFRDGDCLTSPDALTSFAKYGQSNLCGKDGRGNNQAMAVYSYEKDIDGEWGTWGEWERCSQPCGGGTQLRRRFCSNPPAVGSGTPCQGETNVSQSCNTTPCQDRDGSWSVWASWSPCSRACGVGIQYRKRTCDDPTPSGSGKPCPGTDLQSNRCVLRDCQQSQDCGSEAHFGTHGYIHQGRYGKSMSCEYKIITYTGTSVLLQVVEMDIEYSNGCQDDSLMVFDGNSTSSPLLATLCGNIKHSPIRSSGNELFILFESDSTIEASGYSLKWQITHSTYHMCARPVEPINGVMTGSSTYVGDTFVFRCHAGYHLIGPSVITCISFDQYHAVWDNGFPRCDASQPQQPFVEFG
ncbi:bone morphogenetic protein 1-like [Haliotis cracherodii]|uniref:bone morphogenetic protein 1-like n=1 Tax=Haliotis cracherodii TaxID=6455 RepID=UPI0039E7E674